VLNDNVLWDPRASRLIHRFDKFTATASGYFNRSGTEVIINSEVWDLRTLKLVNTCPSFLRSALTFSSTGDVAYALARSYEEGLLREPFQPFFHTVDMSDYSLISATHLERDIWHLATDSQDEYLSVIEEDQDQNETLAHCRIFTIGKNRGNGEDGEGYGEHNDDDDSDDYDSDMSDYSGEMSGGSWGDDDDADDDDGDEFADALFRIADEEGSGGGSDMELSDEGEGEGEGGSDRGDVGAEAEEMPSTGEADREEERADQPPTRRRRRRGGRRTRFVFEERRIDDEDGERPPDRDPH
jgi:HIV-1 Vpr-binding protein